MIFASLKFFLFCRKAKFGQLRLSASAQVVCQLPVSKWQWSETV
jgi:hypothetical protein